MTAGRSVQRVLIAAMTVAGACLAWGGPVAHASSAPKQVGAAWKLPDSSPAGRNLAVLGAQPSGSAVQAAESSAAERARATGAAQVVSSLTSGTTIITAQPDGQLTASMTVLPVRVHQDRRWVPVSTRLTRTSEGRLAPAAVPGDAVSFSGGGTGPMAQIAASGTRLALWWPGRLPVPVVSGSSATYRNVLPGVDLVLTATSDAAGGFREVLVVTSRAAAADPGLTALSLRVTGTGTTGLRAVAGGGLVAKMTGGRGWYQAAAPVMWDSSYVTRSAPGTALRAAASSARGVGADLAGFGIGAKSAVSGPAFGARVAQLGTRVLPGGHVLSLAPDMRMLSSGTTRYPAYIDPGFTTVTNTGSEKGYDPVQSDAGTGDCSSTTGYCDTTNCRGSHYDDSSYSALPVGYDDFEYGACQFSDTDYALYQVAIPQGMFGSHAVLATASLQTAEVYSSSCSASAAVTASWIGGIKSSTGWPGPGTAKNDVDATDTVGPDSGSCNTTEDLSDTVSAGFSLKSDLAKFSGAASNITVRLWEKNNTNDDDHKQFARNPTLQVTWTDTPNTPNGMKEAADNGGTNSLDCATSPSNAPRMGKTDSTNGPSLIATYGDVDGAAVQANIRYENYTSSPGTWTEKDAAIDNLTTASGEQGWTMPASYTSGLADGTIIGWQAQSETGSGTVAGTTYGPYKSSWTTNTCYFAVYPQSPDDPSIAPGFTQGTAQPVGSQVSFTITQSSGDTASEFVWGFDTTPPTTGTIPSAQTCITTAATASCTEISGGSATVTITVPSPGPHDLWVYEVDAGGNDSGMTNGAASGTTWTFSGAGDTGVSYTSGSSLQANFTAALGAGKSFDNMMISTASGTPGNANGDGSGNSFDEAQLTAAGWSTGKTVTIDGATFTLPSFGTSASGADNLLAAAQTIGAGAGAWGSALVFLATSTNSVTQVGGLASGSPDSGSLSSEVTAPAVMGGTPVSGSGCTGVMAFDTNTSCGPATGTINYASGCADGTAVSYTLTVPDWVRGPSDIAALTMPDRDTSGGQQADTPKIYAFAVPVDASCTVSSVTLPDVSGTVKISVASGVNVEPSGLHIFGMALRNDTTATPEVGGSAVASPSGQAWTGAFESPVEDAYAPAPGTTWGDQTVRLWVSSNVSVPAGAEIRIKLSDPGFLSADGTGPLSVGAATIAQQFLGAIPAQAPTTLTFGGLTSVAVSEGGDVYSDPLTLPFSVTAGQNLLISLWLKNASLPCLPVNSFASGGGAWFAPSSTPNETADTTGTPFTGTGLAAYGDIPLLTGIDVTTSEVSSGGVIVSPGEPTAVVAGDNVTDGFSSQPVSDSLDNPSQRLAGQLMSQGLATGYGVVDAGVQSNQLMADGATGGGLSLIDRLDSDILAEPDVGTVILDEGLEDILLQSDSSTLESDLENAYTLLDNQLLAWGINVTTGDLTPCWGYSNSTAADSCSATVDQDRMDIGDYIDSGGGAPNCPAFFDAAVGTGTTTEEALASGYGTSDDVNLTLGTSGGYAALAPAAASCGFYPPSDPLPATS